VLRVRLRAFGLRVGREVQPRRNNGMSNSGAGEVCVTCRLALKKIEERKGICNG
jgi:hypothetical protein